MKFEKNSEKIAIDVSLHSHTFKAKDLNLTKVRIPVLISMNYLRQ